MKVILEGQLLRYSKYSPLKDKYENVDEIKIDRGDYVQFGGREKRLIYVWSAGQPVAEYFIAKNRIKLLKWYDFKGMCCPSIRAFLTCMDGTLTFNYFNGSTNQYTVPNGLFKSLMVSRNYILIRNMYQNDYIVNMKVKKGFKVKSGPHVLLTNDILVCKKGPAFKFYDLNVKKFLKHKLIFDGELKQCRKNVFCVDKRYFKCNRSGVKECFDIDFKSDVNSLIPRTIKQCNYLVDRLSKDTFYRIILTYLFY